MIPRQSHPSTPKSRGKRPGDKSQAHISNVKGTKSDREAGMEGSVSGNKKGKAKTPKGTPVVAPGGRDSRAKGYGL